MMDNESTEDDKSKAELFRCFTIGLAVVSAALSGCLLLVVLPSHWSENAEGIRYLDSYGIGAMAWGAIAGIGSLIMLSFPPQIVDTLAPVESPDVPADSGLSRETHEVVFKDEIGAVRVLKCLGLFGRIVVNVTFIAYNFYALPTRDPKERLNQAKHIVTWVEFPMICLMALTVCVCTLCLCFSGNGRNLGTAVTYLQLSSSFSVLQSIALANPMRFISTMSDTRKTMGNLGLLAKFLTTLFFAPVAVMSLLVKISQIDFVTEELYSEWTITEWARLCAFVNNVAGLIPPQEAAGMEGVLEYVGNGRQHFALKWKSRLAQGLCETFGTAKAFVLYATLTKTDVNRCLNTKMRQHDAYEAMASDSPA
eukprot:TRINITY_DN35652_c0_g1_i1.p1 TRINITY_DN35652_c0_g1~~TRINITY_DN35652_c0_g1_i1.p1  ORF type:complete len:366 (+),score=34.63 TRINITY_DN35652_c0_g1_i1:88-1185(+)